VPGVALDPAVPPSAVRYVLDLVDLLLVMTVNRGTATRRASAAP
jgi:pentose-5-phosphate-3-epimerase